MRKSVFARETYRDQWMTIRQHTTVDGGCEGVYTVVERPDAVIVVASHDDLEHVVLLEVERFPAGLVSLEFPAGGVDGSEGPAVAAAREFEEETGLAVRTCQ